MCKLFPLIFITFGGADIRISIWTQWKVHKYWSSIFFHPCNIQRHLVVRRLFFSSGSAKRFCAKLSFWAAITPSPSPLPCCPCWGSSAEVAPRISRLNRLCQCFLWWWWKCMQDNTPPMHTDISISQQYFMQKWGGSRCCWGRVTAPQSKQETPPQLLTTQIRLQCNVPSLTQAVLFQGTTEEKGFCKSWLESLETFVGWKQTLELNSRGHPS